MTGYVYFKEYIYSDDDSANECSTIVYGELYRVGTGVVVAIQRMIHTCSR